MQLRKHGTARYRAGGMIGPGCWRVYDLIVFLEGSFTFQIPWPELEVTAGDAIIIPPGVAFHAIAGKHGGQIWVSHFTLGRRNEAGWLRAAPPDPFWLFRGGAGSPWCQSLLARISATFPEGGALRECQRLFPLLCETIRAEANAVAASPIREALAQGAELGWKGVTSERLAAWSGYSPSHFRARFEKEMGESVGRYLRARRLETARQLLQNGLLPIKQISDQLGYSSPSAFHHAFLTAHGCTPGDYRQRTVVHH